KGYAKGAKPLRSLRKLCVPCGKYFILILKVYKLFISHHLDWTVLIEATIIEIISLISDFKSTVDDCSSIIIINLNP
ncbi:MAG: hypothetical protein LBD59_02735, partial [Prevotellaceae bacterium]|nr:hypothetical protein [Prevotellaceae bacterium]